MVAALALVAPARPGATCGPGSLQTLPWALVSVWFSIVPSFEFSVSSLVLLQCARKVAGNRLSIAFRPIDLPQQLHYNISVARVGLAPATKSLAL